MAAVLSFQVDCVHAGPRGFSCPEYPAAFVTAVDQLLDRSSTIAPDPEFTFFKEELGFREDDIQHTLQDAFKFFNDRYGLDFSLSSPNEDNEYSFENATLRLIRFSHPGFYHSVVINNWINNGRTCLTCHKIQDGEFQVTFSGNQLLHGSQEHDCMGCQADLLIFTNNANILHWIHKSTFRCSDFVDIP